jgi:hypothetical protein
MADSFALLEDGFREGLWRLLKSHHLEPLLGSLSEDQALALGQEAARHALAPLIWRAAVGYVCATELVRELLGIRRPALAQRVDRGPLVGLAGERTTLYPTWQFAGAAVRECVPGIIAAFRDRLGADYDPRLVASWARTPQPELEEQSPAAWLSEGRDEGAAAVAAMRAAEALSR